MEDAARTRHGWSRRALLVAVVSVVAAAVAGVSFLTRGPGSPMALYDGPDGPTGMDALTSGTLALVDGCLVLVDGHADEAVVPVFYAPRATWDGEAVVVQGTRVEVGARVSLGGGYARDEATPSTLPAACEKYDAYFYAGDISEY